MADEAEVVGAVEVNADDAQADADFDAGFAGEPTGAKAPPADDTPANTDEEKGDEQAGGEPKQEEPPAPEYVQITKQELEGLKALSTQIEQIRAEAKKGIDTAHGRNGELARKLQELQSATPAGYAVEVTDDIVDDLKEEFPELGDKTLSAFKKFAAKLKGTQAAPFDTSQVVPLIDTAKRELAAEVLSLKHEDWEEIVGLKDSNGNIPDTEYRKWLAAQPADYQARIGASWSGRELAKSIDKFKSDAKAAAEKAAAEKASPKASTSARSNRLAAAVTPRGEVGQPPAPSADDEFETGFKTG